MAIGKYKKWLEPESLTLLEGWARDGLIDQQISKNIGISQATLYVWKKKYIEISESLKRGKEVVDFEVENALLKRALGYRYTETTKERLVDSRQKKRHGGESELTEKDWEFAILYFGQKCCYCGEVHAKLTKDHLRPLSKDGKLEKKNVVPCCSCCNSSKKDHEWLSWFQSQSFYDPMRAEKIVDYVSLIIQLNLSEAIDKELVVTKEVEKEVVPDVTAQIFWLKNRKKDQWGDKKEVETSVEFSDDGFLMAISSTAFEDWTDVE